jgi:hypothetical protein
MNNYKWFILYNYIIYIFTHPRTHMHTLNKKNDALKILVPLAIAPLEHPLKHSACL